MKLPNIHRIAGFSLIFAVVAMPLAPSSAYMGVGAIGHSMIGTGVVGRSVSLGDATLTGVYPRIFTPNGDGFNDKVGFHIDNPEELPVTGTIYSLAGTRVADIQPSTTDASGLLLWDGKNSSGQTAPAGIYLYKIDFQGKSATGTVVLAR